MPFSLPYAAISSRRVRIDVQLNQDPCADTELTLQLVLLKPGMGFDLVDCRDDPGGIDDHVQVFLCEVGHPDRLDLASTILVNIDYGLPSLDDPRRIAIDEDLRLVCREGCEGLAWGESDGPML